MEKIGIEVAQKIWCDWLESKDVLEDLQPKSLEGLTGEELIIEKNKTKNMTKMAKAIQKGYVIIEDNIITQKLKYPICEVGHSDNVLFSELCFKNRWNAGMREEVMKGFKGDDKSQSLAASRALCSKLTGINAEVLKRIDGDDIDITDIIVSVFFL